MPTKSRSATVLELRIVIKHIAPPIWRLVLVRPTTTLDQLHSVIQETFGWQDYHLYSFIHSGRTFGRPGSELNFEDSTRMTLQRLGLTAGDTLTYMYDFGDDWHHEVSIVSTRRADPEAFYPRCIDGARAGPPEDCGGPPGYDDLLSVLADSTHERFAELRTWVGPHFRPETFDLRATNRILEHAFG